MWAVGHLGEGRQFDLVGRVEENGPERDTFGAQGNVGRVLWAGGGDGDAGQVGQGGENVDEFNIGLRPPRLAHARPRDNEHCMDRVFKIGYLGRFEKEKNAYIISEYVPGIWFSFS